MSQFVQRIRQQAKAKPKRLILPQGTEPRTIAAAPARGHFRKGQRTEGGPYRSQSYRSPAGGKTG